MTKNKIYMETKNVLVVEDDESLAVSISNYLNYAGFPTLTAYNGKEAIELLENNKSINAIISDIMMPVMDGFSLFRYVRSKKEFDNIPILMITGRNDPDIKYLSFEAGSDSYIIKPFDLIDLLINVKSLIRRTNLIEKENNLYRKQNYNQQKIQLTSNFVINNKSVYLTPAEINIFRYLYKNSSQITTSEELLHKVLHHPVASGNPEVVRTHVKNIRKKIESSRENPSILIHIPKKGYYLNIDNIDIE